MDKRSAAIIIQDGKLLLMHRKKHGHEYFTFPGGRVEDYELPQDTVVRELKEEANIDIVPGDVLYHFVNNELELEEYFYLVSAVKGEPELGGPEKDYMSDDNQYDLVWQPVGSIAQMANLYPEEARKAVLSHIRDTGQPPK